MKIVYAVLNGVIAIAELLVWLSKIAAILVLGVAGIVLVGHLVQLFGNLLKLI